MITFTDKAATAVRRFIQDSDTPEAALLLKITAGGCSGMAYEMSMETGPTAADRVLAVGQFSVVIDPQSLPLLEGVTVEFIDELSGSNFTFINPNASKACNCDKSFRL